MTKDNIVDILHLTSNERKTVEQMLDIRWCRSTFLKYFDTMEKSFMKDEVSHAYHLCNIIRIETKKLDNTVYHEAIDTLGIYSKALYGKDAKAFFLKANGL